MFSKSRNKSSSLKQARSTNSSITTTKDPSPVVNTASSQSYSNFLSLPMNSTSTQPSIQSIKIKEKKNNELYCILT